jgi:hypothetical protein
VQQQMGWLPVPASDGSAAIPQPNGEVPLHPAVLQGLGIMPAPAETPPQPQFQLPLAAPVPEPVQPQAAPPAPEYVVPATAIAPDPTAQAPGLVPTQPAQAARAPQLPRTPAEKLTAAQVKQAEADRTSEEAVRLQAQAELQKNAEIGKVYDAHAANAEAIQKDLKAKQDDYLKTRATKEAQAVALLKQSDDYKIDRGQFQKEMGAGGAIGWGIATLLSAVGDYYLGKAGQPNPVLQMMQQAMNANVQKQMDERERLKGRAANAFHALDKYDAFSKDRMAQTALLEARNDKMLADYIQMAASKTADSATLARAAKAIGELRQSSAEKAEKAAEYATKLDVDQKQLGVSQYNAATSRLGHQETVRHNLATEDLAQQSKDLEAIKLTQAGKTDQAKLVQERAIGGEAEVQRGPDGKIVLDKDGKPVVNLGVMRLKDGSIFLPKGDAKKLQEAHSTTKQYVGALDRIRELGPEWMSNVANSEKKQQLQQAMQTAKNLAIRLLELGVPTGKDVEMAENFVGAGDLTGFRDVLGGINESRRTALRLHNAQLETADYDRPWTIPDPLSAPKSAPTPEEKTLTDLKVKPSLSYDRAFKEAAQYTLKEIKDPVEATRAARAEAERYKVVTPSQTRKLKQLEQQALSGDQVALSSLDDLAKDAATGYVEAMARDAADRVRRAIEVQKSSVREDAGPQRTGYDPRELVRRFNPNVDWTGD